MSYFYDYLGKDQDLLVESDVPRPDLLEWAYWREIDADEAARIIHTREPELPSAAAPNPEPPPAVETETATTADESTTGDHEVEGDAPASAPDVVTSEPEAKKSTPRKASAKKAA